MTSRPRVSLSMRCMRGVIVTTLTAILCLLPGNGSAQGSSAATRAQSPAGVNAQAAALAEFQKRLDAYLNLREALSNKAKPLSSTPDAADLTARQETLAAAMKSARAGARQGDLIPRAVADHIGTIIAADRKRREPAARNASLEEVPGLPTPAINVTYPANAPLPTLPPLLLAQLPGLPDNLQYRFYGRHLVILDGDLQIITDYVSNVLPPR